MKTIKITYTDGGAEITFALRPHERHNVMHAALSAMAGYAPEDLSPRGNVQVWDRSTAEAGRIEIIGEDPLVGRLVRTARAAAVRELRRVRGMR